MAVYGSEAGVKALLKTTAATVFDADATSRILALLPVVSAVIEEETGREFGPARAAQFVLAADSPSRFLWLPDPIVSVGSVVGNPFYDGLEWTSGPESGAVAAGRYSPWFHDQEDGSFSALAALDFEWAGVYLLTGVAYPAEAVPPEITYAANYMASVQFKIEGAGAAGFTGPAGSVLPVRNLLKDPLVRSILGRHGRKVDGEVWF